MRKMGITEDMTVGTAMELFPHLLPAFQQLGMCCVNPENEDLTVLELCRQYHMDAASFVEAVNTLLS